MACIDLIYLWVWLVINGRGIFICFCSHNCKELYFEDEGEAIAFVSMLQSSPSLADLRNEVLMEIASQLKHTSRLSPTILRVIPLIGEDLTNQCTVTMETLEADATATCQPVSPL